MKFFQHGIGIFRPKNNCVDICLVKGNFVENFGVHGIGRIAIAFLEAFKKPFAVICRNICSSACTDDHGLCEGKSVWSEKF